MKVFLLLIPLLFLSSCMIDWNGVVNFPSEVLRGIINLFIALAGVCIGFSLWKKQEKIKKTTESGINLLVALAEYKVSIEQARPIGFLLTDTEENIRNKHWENILKSWKNLTSAYTIACTTIYGLKDSTNLDGILDIQNELYANLSTYLERKNTNKYKDDNSDREIAKIIRRNINPSEDTFAIGLNNEIEKISQKVESHKNINI